jgi:hypothetical protein
VRLCSGPSERRGAIVIWILLAALGVPVWLVVGILAAALINRRRFKRVPGVFSVRLRRGAGAAQESKDKWRRAQALWVHDVLLVYQGIALMRVRPLPVAEMLEESTPPPPVGRRSGGSARAMRLRLDDGSEVTVAFAEEDAAKALPTLANAQTYTDDASRPAVTD